MSPRPTDWSPLGLQDDPTPGDPDVIDGIVNHMRSVRDASGAAGTGLQQIIQGTGDGALVGSTGDWVRGEIDGKTKDFLGQVSHAFGTSEPAMASYVTKLRDAQAIADGALARAVGLPKDSAEHQALVRQALDAGDDLTAAAGVAAGLVDTVATARSPWAKSACEAFWQAFEWIVLAVTVVAVFVGGPLGLIAFGLNGVLAVKAVVDFAEGRIGEGGLILGLIGVLAPSTKALSLAGMFKSAKGAFTHLITKSPATMSKLGSDAWLAVRSFNLSAVVKGVVDVSNVVASAFKVGAVYVVKGMSGAGLASGGFVTLRGFSLTTMSRAAGQGVRWITTAAPSVGRQVWRASRIGTVLSNELGGWKALRIFTPLHAGEIGTLGVGGAFKVGVLGRGMMLPGYRTEMMLAGKLGAGVQITDGALRVSGVGSHGVGDTFRSPGLHLPDAPQRSVFTSPHPDAPDTRLAGPGDGWSFQPMSSGQTGVGAGLRELPTLQQATGSPPLNAYAPAGGTSFVPGTQTMGTAGGLSTSSIGLAPMRTFDAGGVHLSGDLSEAVFSARLTGKHDVESFFSPEVRSALDAEGITIHSRSDTAISISLRPPEQFSAPAPHVAGRSPGVEIGSTPNSATTSSRAIRTVHADAPVTALSHQARLDSALDLLAEPTTAPRTQSQVSPHSDAVSARSSHPDRAGAGSHSGRTDLAGAPSPSSPRVGAPAIPAGATPVAMSVDGRLVEVSAIDVAARRHKVASSHVRHAESVVSAVARETGPLARAVTLQTIVAQKNLMVARSVLVKSADELAHTSRSVTSALESRLTAVLGVDSASSADCLVRLDRLHDALYPASSGAPRGISTVDDALAPTAALARKMGADGWSRVHTWSPVEDAVRSGSHGTTGFVHASPPGAPQHAFAVMNWHGNVRWVELQNAGGSRVLDTPPTVPVAARAIVLGPDGVLATIDDAAEWSRSRTVDALVDSSTTSTPGNRWKDKTLPKVRDERSAGPIRPPEPLFVDRIAQLDNEVAKVARAAEGSQESFDKLVADLLPGVEGPARQARAAELRFAIDRLGAWHSDEAVNAMARALKPYDTARPAVGVPGAEFVPSSYHNQAAGEGFINRDIAAVVTIEGKHYTPVYMSVFSDALSEPKPRHKDFGQDDDGLIRIHPGADNADAPENTLWVSIGQSFRQLKWVESYALNSHARPLVRSFLIPLEDANWVSRHAVTEHKAASTRADFNVDKHYGSNQFGIREEASLERLRRSALPGSLRTYADVEAWASPNSGTFHPLEELRAKQGQPAARLRNTSVFTDEAGGFLSHTRYKEVADRLNAVVQAHQSVHPNKVAAIDAGKSVRQFYIDNAPVPVSTHGSAIPAKDIDEFVRELVIPWANQARIAEIVYDEFEAFTTTSPLTDPANYRLAEQQGEFRGQRRTEQLQVGEAHGLLLDSRFVTRTGVADLGPMRPVFDEFKQLPTSQRPPNAAKLVGDVDRFRREVLEDYDFRIGASTDLQEVVTRYRQEAGALATTLATSYQGLQHAPLLAEVIAKLTDIAAGQPIDIPGGRSG